MGGRAYNIRAEVVVEASRSWHAAAKRIADQIQEQGKTWQKLQFDGRDDRIRFLYSYSVAL